MDRLYPNPIVFINGSDPDLSADNLNEMSRALGEVDKRAAQLGTYAAEVQQAYDTAIQSAQIAQESAISAERSAQEAFAGTPAGYSQLVQNVDNIKTGVTTRPFSKVWTDGYYVDYLSGNTGAVAYWSMTDYMPIKPNTTYEVKGAATWQGCLFTNSKTYIRGYNSATTFTTGANAAFIRVSCYAVNKNAFEIIEVGGVNSYLMEDISGIKQTLADAWYSTKPYVIGDRCISGDVLYRCKVANSNIKPPNTTYWDPTTLDAELGNLNSSKLNVVLDRYYTPNSSLLDLLGFTLPPRATPYVFLITSALWDKTVKGYSLQFVYHPDADVYQIMDGPYQSWKISSIAMAGNALRLTMSGGITSAKVIIL